MKGVIAVVFLGLIFVATIGIVVDVNAKTDHIHEIEDSITVSMENTMKATCVDKMYPIENEEMSAEFLRNLAESMNSDSTFDIFVFENDKEGILDVKVKSHFFHLNGEKDDVEVRKTLILEKIKNPEFAFCKEK